MMGLQVEHKIWIISEQTFTESFDIHQVLSLIPFHRQVYPVPCFYFDHFGFIFVNFNKEKSHQKLSEFLQKK